MKGYNVICIVKFKLFILYICKKAAIVYCSQSNTEIYMDINIFFHYFPQFGDINRQF